MDVDDERAVLTLLLGDSRFPSGSYAHSLGLEEAVVGGGLEAGAVPAFMAARSRLMAEIDARFAVAARRSPGSVAEMELEWCARCPSPVLRDAARRLGAQLLRSAAAIWDVPVARMPRPLALGVVGAAAGLGDEEVALLALYDDASTVGSAALKLLPVDPAVASRWVAELAPALAAAARAVAADRRPVSELPAASAIAIELAAPVHRNRRERLFAT
jgi:urease accessory protein